MVEAPKNGYYDQLRADYHERRELLSQALQRAGLPVLPISGSYFLQTWFDHLPFDDDVAFSTWLIEHIGVTPIPPSAFYLDPVSAPKLVRWCFAKTPQTLALAGDRLGRLPDVIAQQQTCPVQGRRDCWATLFFYIRLLVGNE